MHNKSYIACTWLQGTCQWVHEVWVWIWNMNQIQLTMKVWKKNKLIYLLIIMNCKLDMAQKSKKFSLMHTTLNMNFISMIQKCECLMYCVWWSDKVPLSRLSRNDWPIPCHFCCGSMKLVAELFGYLLWLCSLMCFVQQRRQRGQRKPRPDPEEVAIEYLKNQTDRKDLYVQFISTYKGKFSYFKMLCMYGICIHILTVTEKPKETIL